MAEISEKKIEHSSLSIRLKKANKTFEPGELVEGVVIVSAKEGWAHQGLQMKVEGKAMLELGNKANGFLDILSEDARPLELLLLNFDVTSSGRVAAGITEIPFEFILEESKGVSLHETYHGVYTTVAYFMTLECKRTLMRSTLTCQEELIVECPTESKVAPVPQNFSISPDVLENLNKGRVSSIPKFKIQGRLDTLLCAINQPFTGEITIEESEVPVKSIEIQLIRVESVISEGKEHREATEIQNIQVADGDVSRLAPVPIYFVFPRIFSCSSVACSCMCLS